MKATLRFRFVLAISLLLASIYVCAQPPSPELDVARGMLRRASVSKDDPQIDRLLSEALKDNDWSVRATAVQMIAFDGRSVLREELVPLFRDKNEKVRFRAAGAYIHLSSLSENGALPFGATRLDQ